jgi:hypothetical protein
MGDALHAMRADILWVLRQPEGSLVWRYNKNELMDLIHTVASCSAVYDDNGHPLTFCRLVALVLPVFGYAVPANASSYIVNPGHHPEYIPMHDRYRRKIAEGKPRPILDFIATRQQAQSR